MFDEKAYNKQYRIHHKAERKEYDKNRYQNSEEYREYLKNYTQTHRKQAINRAKKWYLEHPEKVKARVSKWQKEHPEQRKKIRKKWRMMHPEQEKELKAKRRKLGFIELNYFFEGSEPHHIDKIHVIYIPYDLHHSIYHEVWTGRGMKEINARALEYLSMVKPNETL